MAENDKNLKVFGNRKNYPKYDWKNIGQKLYRKSQNNRNCFLKNSNVITWKIKSLKW